MCLQFPLEFPRELNGASLLFASKGPGGCYLLPYRRPFAPEAPFPLVEMEMHLQMLPPPSLPQRREPRSGGICVLSYRGLSGPRSHAGHAGRLCAAWKTASRSKSLTTRMESSLVIKECQAKKNKIKFVSSSNNKS